MKPDREDLIKEISKSSIALKPGERRAFIEDRCGDDETLKSAVNERVRQYEEARDYFGDLGARLGLGGLGDARFSAIEGQQIGKYIAERMIGKGGMGLVYKAKDSQLNRPVALKFLAAKYVDDDPANERFLREARAAAALNHPNVVTVYEIIEHNGLPVIVMEYIAGETLRDKLEAGPLETAQVLDYTGQIARGLSGAHKAGVIHRDLKPANIMVTRDGTAKILDFGLAKLREASLLTREGTTLGTVAYMSPEQARGEETDERTDIWALGVMVYEMLAGRRPFRNANSNAVIYGILHEDPEPVKQHAPAVTPVIEAMLHKTLAKQPDNRYKNLDAFLEDFDTEKPGIVPNISLKGRRSGFTSKHRNAYYGAALLLVVVIGVLIFSMSSPGSNVPLSSIAVLPLANMTGDIENEAQANGVTDALIDKLGQIGSIERVISRTSVMQFKDKPTSLSEIGKLLSVDALIEGSYRADQENVQVDIRLIDAKTEERLWSKSFLEPLGNQLQMQNDMALEIAQQLEVDVMQNEQELLENAREVNPEAYALYLKGHHMLLWVRGDDSNRQATQFFLDSIALDSTFFPAYAGLAKSYTFQVWEGRVEREELARKAESALSKAITLGGNTSEIYVTQGVMLQFFEREWSAAEAALRQAIKVDHRNAEAYRELGLLFSRTGRHDQAIAEFEKAMAIDPLFAEIYASFAQAYLYKRQFDAASRYIQMLLDMYPGNPTAYAEFRALLYIQQGKGRNAVDLLTESLKHNPNDYWYSKTLGYVYAVLGNTDEAEKILQYAIDKWDQGRANAVDIARIYTGLDDNDNAFEWLERSFEPRKYGLETISLIINDPSFDVLRSDPRFEPILNRVNEYLQIEE